MNHEPDASQPDRMSTLVVDSHALSREGYKLLIDRLAETDCLGTFARLEQALPVARSKQPGVVILSFDRDSQQAFDGVSDLAREAPEARVVLVTGRARDEDIRRALDADVAGFVQKDEGIDEIGAAIRAVHRGEFHYSRRILSRIGPFEGEFRPSKETKTRFDLLSLRERELLVVLASGYTLREACVKLQVTYKTADKHKVSLMRKLDIHDRVSLARYAIREGLVVV